VCRRATSASWSCCATPRSRSRCATTSGRSTSWGEYFKIDDPATKAPALRNPFAFIKPGDMPLPEAALEKLVARGVRFGVCHTAIHHQSMRIAKMAGVAHDVVKNDMLAAVIPGVQVVPSGVLAVNGAQTKGCTYCFAG
jgi:intracellular sulfur oxidation DsrE/DsrF family protein